MKRVKREEKYLGTCNNIISSKYSRESCVIFTYKGNCKKQEHHASTWSNKQTIPDKKINI